MQPLRLLPVSVSPLSPHTRILPKWMGQGWCRNGNGLLVVGEVPWRSWWGKEAIQEATSRSLSPHQFSKKKALLPPPPVPPPEWGAASGKGDKADQSPVSCRVFLTFRHKVRKEWWGYRTLRKVKGLRKLVSFSWQRWKEGTGEDVLYNPVRNSNRF